MSRPYIIAEIASAHEGEAEFAKRLVARAAETGADAVKLQIFRRDTLLSRFHHKFDAFGIIELTETEWREVLVDAAATGMDVLVEVFDEASLALAEASGVVSGYKLPTSDIANFDLIRRIGETCKPLYLAVGGATLDEVKAALDVMDDDFRARVVLMHGFQSFPTKVEDTNLARLRTLADAFGLPVGYADHVDADDGMQSLTIPAMAIGAGAVVIEKHMTENRSLKGRDYYSSLNPDEFAAFVQSIRLLWTAMGNPRLDLSVAEKDYRRLMKRQAVMTQDARAGTVIDSSLIVYKRIGRDGLSPSEAGALLGRRLKTAKQADEALLMDDLD